MVTEWKQFRSPDFQKLREQLKDAVVFDGRNLYEPAEVEAAGLAYYGIGRGVRCMSDLPTEREQALEARPVELEMRVSFRNRRWPS